MKNGDLKRDKQFQNRLSKEYGVARPPESFYQAVGNALDSLPDELPVKHRPLRAALRTCAALAACALVLVGGSLWLNGAYPQVTESLPGVGQLFQNLNDTAEEVQPSPSPTPEDLSQSSLPFEEETAFVPETFLSDPAESGLDVRLVVQNAWSDGIYLHLELELQMDSSLWDPSWSWLTTCPVDDVSSETCTVLVNGEPAELPASTSQRAFQYAGTQEDRACFQAEWTVKLKERSGGPQVDVYLELPYIGTAWTLTGPGQELNPLISGQFQAPCDPSRNFLWDSPVEDNGVTLRQVESSPLCTKVSVAVPFFGRTSYTLSASDVFSDGSSLPLGIYGQLSLPGGGLLGERNDIAWDASAQEELLRDENSQGPYDLTFWYDALPESASQAVLTLYEYPRYSATLPDFLENNRVVAEFTIDLESRQVYPSENYREEGLAKLPLSQSLEEDRAPQPIAGYICSSPTVYYDKVEVTLYTQDMEYRPVAVYRYWDDVLMGISYSYPAEDYNSQVWIGDVLYPAHQDENGLYTEHILTAPLVQEDYKQLYFAMENIVDTDFTRLALVDTETGEELIPDIQRAYCQQADQLLGTRLEEERYDRAAGGSSPSPSGQESAEASAS